MPELDLSPPIERKMVEFWYGRKQRCRVRAGETCLEAVTRKIKEMENCDSLLVMWDGEVELTSKFRWYVMEFIKHGRERNGFGLVCIPDYQEIAESDINAMLAKILMAKSTSSVQ